MVRSFAPEEFMGLPIDARFPEGLLVPEARPGKLLSPLQGAATTADAELYVDAQVYQHEAKTGINKIDERIAAINEQLNTEQLDQSLPSNPGKTLDLFDERNNQTLEREKLTNNVATTESTFEALRGGGPPIGLSSEILEKVVADRDILDDRINALEAEIDALTEVTGLSIPDPTRAQELMGLKTRHRNMLNMGLVNQEIVNTEARLANGETITWSTKHPLEDAIVESVVDGAIGYAIGWTPLGIAAKVGVKVVDNVPTLPDREIIINRRDDGVYEIV